MCARNQASIFYGLISFESKFILQKCREPSLLNFLEEHLKLSINAYYLGSNSINVGSNVKIVTPMLVVDSFQIIF
jgi:hypothetical protein